MGRPTLAEQIAKAAASGDIKKVQELANRLSPKPKSKTKAKATKEKVKVVASDDNGDFIAKARSSDNQAASKYIDEDGNERVRARVVPFKIVKNRKNKFVDDLQEEVEDLKFDKAWQRKVKTKKIKKAKRDPVSKIKVKCYECKDMKEVWPGEVMHRNWICDDCLAAKHK